MKIGFFIPNATFDMPGSPEVGGIETFTFLVGEALQKMGHEVVLYGGKPKPGRTYRKTTLNVKLFDYIETSSIPDIGTRFQRLIQRVHFGFKCRDSFLAENFNAVILAKPFDWPVARQWKRRQPKLKTVMGFHGTDFFAFDRFFYSSIDKAFAVSPHVADLAQDRIKKRPVVISNPVDIDFFTPGKKSDVNPAALRIAASGRLIGWKGFGVLIEAAKLLKNEGFSLQVDLAGEGPQRAEFENAAETNDLHGLFRFKGRLSPEDLLELLRNADIYVAPSIGMEAFSISALEAASVGLPLILSDQIGLAAFLSKNDFLSYPARDASALAEVIKKAAGMRKDTAWINDQARHKRIREQFAPAITAAKILELLS